MVTAATTIDALLAAREQLEAEYRKDMAAFDHLLSRIGYRASEQPQPTQAPSAVRPVRTADAPTKPGSLRDWVERAFQTFPGATLSSPTIYDWAVGQGATPQTDRDKTIASFGNVLRAMATEGKLKIVVQGSGRRPSAYAVVREERDQQLPPM